MEVLDVVLPAKCELYTIVGHLAEILVRSRLVADRRIDRSLVEDSVGHFVVPVGLECESSVEDGELKSDVGRGSGLPSQRAVGQRLHDA